MAAQFNRLGPRYKGLGLQTDPAIVTARLQGAQAAMEAVSAADVPILVRAALGRAGVDEIKPFLKHFQAEDPTFGPKPGDQEVELLAAELLLEIVNGSGKKAPIAALSVVCANFGGMREFASEPELVTTALERLGALQRSDPPKAPTHTKKPDTAQLFSTADAHGPTNQLSQAYPALKGLAEAALDYTERASKHQANQLTDLLAYFRRIEEETRIQWWITNAWSNDAQKELAELDALEVAVRAAKELADLTTQLLGPFSAAALLSIAIRNARADDRKTISIGDAPALVPIAWRRAWVGKELDQGLAQLTPALAAFALATESEDAADWKPRFTRVTGIDATKSIGALPLSLQLFRERLLLRALAKEAQ